MGRPLCQPWAENIGTLVHWYRTLVHWYIGSLVLWFVAALALAVKPKPSVYVCRVYVLYEKAELLPT